MEFLLNPSNTIIIQRSNIHMDPSTLAILGIAISSLVSAASAVYAIIICAPALASVTSEKPEYGNKLLITIVLGEALAIYGLLIAFMIISKLPAITTFDAGIRALFSGIVMGGAAIAASLGISYTGPALMTAVVEKPESYTTNILGVVLSEALAIYGLLIAFMLLA
jgi:F0F1-type ATP synthase membrane subunit c/vacuolar-type H+-ATPase subunit K